MQSLRLLVFLPLLASPVLSAQESVKPQKVDFVRDIQPLLKARCWECHGIDEQEGDLRLDLKSWAFPKDEDLWMIIPGKVDESELIDRISLPKDDADIMPEEGEPLTKEQILLLRRWVEQGAPWPESADTAVIEAEKKVRAKSQIVLQELDAAGKAAEQQALTAVVKRGAHAMKVAADTEAVDVNFSLLGAKASDQDIGLLDGLQTNLIWLNLSRTSIGDASLKQLANFTELRRLNLSKTAITDAGLAHLAKLEHLDYLNLYGTKVTDAGLAHVQGLNELKKLYAWQTGVTEKGVAALVAAIPGLRVDVGDYAKLVVKTITKTGGKMINKLCPITGKPARADKIAVHDGKTVGFCCDKCLAKFKKNPAQFVGKIPELKAKPAAKKRAAKATKKAGKGKKRTAKGKKPVNSVCPVTGKAIDATKVTTVDGKVVAFCCGKCLAKFKKNPAQFVGKIPELKAKPAAKKKAARAKKRAANAKKRAAKATKPINSVCPVTGKAIDATKVTTFDGKVVAFCCGKCLAKFKQDPAKYSGKISAKK